MLDDKVIKIIPIDAEVGSLALATPNAVGGLRHGAMINGAVVGVTTSGCRIFKPATSKGAHKSWDDYLCDSAAVVKTEGRGYSLVGLFGDGNARAFSLPALKEIGCSSVGHIVDMRRISESVIAPNGNVLVWTTPSEVGLFNVWGSGSGLYVNTVNSHIYRQTADFVIDNLLKTSSLTRRQSPLRDLPLRMSSGFPAPNTFLQLIWISLVRAPTELIAVLLLFADNFAVGGPERPPSKRMQEQMKLDEQERRRAAREGRAMPNQAPQRSQEGYMSYMQRQVNERTERIGNFSDSMDRLEENSSGWARDVNKYVQNQKRKALFGGKISCTDPIFVRG